jgi:cytochrome c oxidase subunit 2
LKRRNTLLLAFGTIVTVVVFALFIIMGWQFVVDGNSTHPLTTLTPQGPFASSIQTLVNPVFLIAAVVFFGVLGAVIGIGFRFRDRGDLETADVLPHQLHGRTFLEISWTVAPAVVLLIVGVATVATLSTLNAEPKPDALHVRVTGQQWWWQFRYDLTDYHGQVVPDGDRKFDDPEDVVTANELVIPTGTEIALSETSNDVIHSFWIPALNGKKDAVPGLISDWKLQADQPGVYRGQCTEFCGLSHGNMRMLVRAVSPADFETWKADQAKPAATPADGTVAAAGLDVFKAQLCSSCHLIRGVNDAKVADPKTGVKSQLVSGVAPDLTHFASRGTFAGSILNSHYPNPSSNPNQPFGQTCTVEHDPGSGKGPSGTPVDESSLPTCPDANQPDTFGDLYATSPGNPDNPDNAVSLAAWLRDPPSIKPMSPDPADNPDAGGRRRGMPNLHLTEAQIDALVAYLYTLK